MKLSISRREWFWVVVVALAVAALLTIPYLLGFGLSRPGTVYTGTLMNAEDTQTYFAKMGQGYTGSWLYRIPFTPEIHQGAFVGGFYLALGQLANFLNTTVMAVWHGARFISGFILFLSTFAFVSTFLHQRQARWTAYLLAITGSGLGWFLFATGQTEWLGAFPVDFKMPEAHLFFSALTFPHVALGTSTLLATFWLILRALSDHPRRWLYAFLSGLANLLLAILYPFMIFLVIVVVALYWIFLSLRARRPLWRYAAEISISFVIPLPLLVYYASVLRENTVFQAWSEQAATLSPPWPHYLIAYGLMLTLALLPLVKKRRRPGQDPPLIFLWFWVLAAAILVYVPVNQQRRYVQGVHIALAILATVGLMDVVLPWLRSTRPFQKLASLPRYSTGGLEQLVLFVFLIFMALSNIYLLADVSLNAAVRQPFPFFRAEEEQLALDWLEANVDSAAVVMAASDTGNYLAAKVGNPVVLGHWAETVDFDARTREAKRFYSKAADDEWRQAYLSKHEVDYVWYGLPEQYLGDINLGDAHYLDPVYQGTDTTIFSVR